MTGLAKLDKQCSLFNTCTLNVTGCEYFKVILG